MKNTASASKEQRVHVLEAQLKKLESALAAMRKTAPTKVSISVKTQKTEGRFKRIRDPHGPDMGIGDFFLLLDITAVQDTIYIPLSIASGKKPTGFMYQIEGTTKGALSTTTITAKGDGITQITLGTILYVKIPTGKTATFRIQIEMKGQMQNTYKIVVQRINYKLNPSDARYKQYLQEIHTGILKMH